MSKFDQVVKVLYKYFTAILLLYRVSTGTAHGFGLFDYAQKKEVFTKCTLNPSGKNNVNYHERKVVFDVLSLHLCCYRKIVADLTGTGDSAMSRRKSFKKSLRESFRRLRRRRSERKKKTEGYFFVNFSDDVVNVCVNFRNFSNSQQL